MFPGNVFLVRSYDILQTSHLLFLLPSQCCPSVPNEDVLTCALCLIRSCHYPGLSIETPLFTCHRSVTIKLQARSFFTWYCVSKAATCLWRSWTGSYRWRIEFTVTRGTHNHSSTAEDEGRKTRIKKRQHLKWTSDLCCSQEKQTGWIKASDCF